MAKDEVENEKARIERCADNLYGALCTIAADTSAKAWLFACLDTLRLKALTHTTTSDATS